MEIGYRCGIVSRVMRIRNGPGVRSGIGECGHKDIHV